MTAGCARCGACCDPVLFSREAWESVTAWSTEMLEGVPDPRTDEGWAWWQENVWQDRDLASAWYDPDGMGRANADFMAAHWTPLDDETCACDMFDRETRLCMAQDSKPPVCSRYPWYGDDPAVRGGEGMPSQCSYLADLPPDQRPEGARPLIPLIPLIPGSKAVSPWPR